MNARSQDPLPMPLPRQRKPRPLALLDRGRPIGLTREKPVSWHWFVVGTPVVMCWHKDLNYWTTWAGTVMSAGEVDTRMTEERWRYLGEAIPPEDTTP